MIIFEMFVAFVATLAFAVIFNVNKKELLFCGLSGLAAEGAYQIAMELSETVILSVLISTLVVTSLSRILANLRKVPVTVYLVSGIIPLVPGAGMYNTIYNIISSEYSTALTIGIDTIKIAAVIAIGIIFVFALPNKIFFKLKK